MATPCRTSAVDLCPHSRRTQTAPPSAGPLACRRISKTFGTCKLLEMRSEEHTSELQSHSDLVCRLLLEKKKKKKQNLIPLRQEEKTALITASDSGIGRAAPSRLPGEGGTVLFD